MEYSERELQRKTIPDLKDILRDKGLKISGKKDELIERILQNQTIEEKEQLPNVGYFSLLPKDIKGLVSEYQVRNNENNILFEKLFTNILLNSFLFNTSNQDRMKKQFSSIGIDTDVKYKNKKVEIDFNKIPLLSDKDMKNVLSLLINDPLSPRELNDILKYIDSNYRIVYTGGIYETRSQHEIIKGKIL